MYIAITGNIGAGKTELGKLLAESLHGHFLPEQEELHHPIIEQFYQDMEKWAFHLQIYFLEVRLGKILFIQNQPREKLYILDRSLYEDAEVFAYYLHNTNFLSQFDYEIYISLYRKVKKLISPPDLLVFLDGSVSTLVERIVKRNRPYERNIKLSYLNALNHRFREWYENYSEGKKIRIDIDRYDVVERDEDRYEVINLIIHELYGLFPE